MDDDDLDDDDDDDDANDDDDDDDLHSTGSCHEELHGDICAVDPSSCKDWEPGQALHSELMN